MPQYRIADLIVQMETYGKTQKLAEPYRIESQCVPDITIETDPTAFRARFPGLDDDYAQYLESGSIFYTKLTAFDAMMLHASCVVVDDEAYLFTAACGTGKSTQTKLWQELFGERAYILNDDKPALRVFEDGIFVYGTPWSGKHGINRNERVRLKAVCVIQRAKNNEIHEMPAEQAIRALLEQTTRNLAPEQMGCVLSVLDRVISADCVYDLHCNMDISAARTAYHYIHEKRIKT